MASVPSDWCQIPGYLHYDEDGIYRIRFYHPVHDIPTVFAATIIKNMGYKVPTLSSLRTVATADEATVFVWFKIDEIKMDLISASDLKKKRIEI